MLSSLAKIRVDKPVAVHSEVDRAFHVRSKVDKAALGYEAAP